MKSYPDKKIIASLFALTIILGFVGRQLEWHHQQVVEYNANEAAVMQAIANPQIQEVSLGFVGDIMLDREVKIKVEKNLGGDYSRLFVNAGFLSKPDITFGNLEGPVSDQGKDLHNLYSFRMDPKVLPVLKQAGVDVVSFANNHIGDWGRPAFEDTLVRLNQNGILACGAGMTKTDAEKPAIIVQNGYKIGFLCFSDVGPENMTATNNQSGILLASDKDFDSIIKSAKSQVDDLIVSFHSGIEYQTKHNARQEEIFKKAVDDGADFVVGAHPHVAEDSDTYKGVSMFYSLGNFIFDQPFSKDTMNGLFVTAKIKSRTVTDILPQQVTLDKNYAPSLLIKSATSTQQ